MVTVTVKNEGKIKIYIFPSFYLFRTAAIAIVVVLVFPLVHGTASRVHEKIADRGDFKTKLLCYCDLHFFGRPFGLFKYGL